MIIHVEDKLRGHSPCFAGVTSNPDGFYEPARRFTQERKVRLCPRCMGLSTRENATFDCQICGNTGEIEVDVATELPDGPGS